MGEALVEALGSVVPSWRHLLEPSQPPGGCGDWQGGGRQQLWLLMGMRG